MINMILRILVLSLLLSFNARAAGIIIIKCTPDDSNKSEKPVYHMNLSTGEALVGNKSMMIDKWSDSQITLIKPNTVGIGLSSGVSEKIILDRLSGKYKKLLIIHGEDKTGDKKITSTGTCRKITKAF